MLLLYISPLVTGVILGLFLIIFVARNRHVPGVPALMTSFLAAMLWSAGYALEIIASDLQSKLFWAKVEYLGIVTIPLAWFFFTLQYLGSPKWMARGLRYKVILAIVPMLTLGLVWTNEAHGLIWQQVALQRVGQVQMLSIEHGAWFWLYLAYGYCILGLGSAWLVGRLLSLVRFHRWQIILSIIAVLIPWIGNIVYISGVSPIPHLDWTPFAFTLAGLLFTRSLLQFHFINFLPIALQSVFDGQLDCVFVLDGTGRIVELNPAAQRLLRNDEARLIERPLFEVLPAVASLIEPGNPQEAQVEISLGEGPELRHFDLHASPLTGQYPQPIGWLVVLHDVTELKQESEESYRFLFENAGDAILLVGLQGNLQQVNQKGAELLGYSLEEIRSLTIFDITDPSEHADVQHKMDQVLNGQTLLPYVRHFRARSGQVVPVEISLALVCDSAGKPKFFQSIVRDISSRVRAEQAQNRLLEELKRSREDLRALTFRLEEVQEIERRQIVAELHDRVGQNLTGLNLTLQLAVNRLPGLGQGPEGELQKLLHNALNLVEETTQQVRDVMAELHPPGLDQYGLVAALHWYSRVFSQRTGIAVQVIGEEVQPRLPASIEMVLFRIAQEALNNVAKHAQATKLTICVEPSADLVWLKVRDDGRGFDLQALNSPSGAAHWGLLTMQQRAASIGGRFIIESTLGLGTRIAVGVRRTKDDS